ncbi:MAG: SprT-like domain-containing protein [Planctomycetaceae bacterium]
MMPATRGSARGLVEIARPHLPPAAVDHVARACGGLRMDLRVVRPRRSKLGDHRPPHPPRRPRHHITVNADLNPWAFLTTLLHEVAHAATWERHARSRRWVRPHGPEWQAEFAAVLQPFLDERVFPAELAAAVRRSLASPTAATCSDRGLLLALARYDQAAAGRVRVEELAEGAWFRVDGRHVFRAGRLVRTRRRCFMAGSDQEYRVHGLLAVEPLDGPPAVSVSSRRRQRWR